MQGGGFRLEGARELYATFAKLPRATQRNALMRVLKEAIEPLAFAVAQKAPYETGYLAAHQFTGPTSMLNKSQRKKERRDAGKFEAMIHFGTADPAGLMNEFGTINQAAQPFFRSEWESQKNAILREIQNSLGRQIEAAGRRYAKRLAKRR